MVGISLAVPIMGSGDIAWYSGTSTQQYDICLNVSETCTCLPSPLVAIQCRSAINNFIYIHTFKVEQGKGKWESRPFVDLPIANADVQLTD